MGNDEEGGGSSPMSSVTPAWISPRTPLGSRSQALDCEDCEDEEDRRFDEGVVLVLGISSVAAESCSAVIPVMQAATTRRAAGWLISSSRAPHTPPVRAAPPPPPPPPPLLLYRPDAEVLTDSRAARNVRVAWASCAMAAPLGSDSSSGWPGADIRDSDAASREPLRAVDLPSFDPPEVDLKNEIRAIESRAIEADRNDAFIMT